MKKKIAVICGMAAIVAAAVIFFVYTGGEAEINNERAGEEAPTAETQGGNEMEEGNTEETVFSRNGVDVRRKGGEITLSNGKMTVVYDTESGFAEIEDGKGKTVFSGVYAEAVTEDETLKSSEMTRDSDCVTVTEIDDEFGNGALAVIRSYEGDVEFLHKFYLYEDYRYILVRAELVSGKGIKTNNISPLTAVGEYDKPVLFTEEYVDPRFLFVPFDNDAFVRYSSEPLLAANESYEVTAIFDNTTREGFVVGSVTHDTWKTGIRVKHGLGNAVIEFRAFGGITSYQTRDTLPHGFVAGERVSSPTLMVGFYDDYRDALEEYGAANAVVAPALEWDRGVPFGWNSWSAVADKVSYDIYVNSSDFVKENLQEQSFSGDDGLVFINFDSFWDNLTEKQLKDAAQHAKDNGQIPGIYYTPFTFWGGGYTSGAVPGTNNRYSYQDIVLKDDNGTILPAFDGGVSIDPTHPGAIMRMQYQFDKFREWGYEYVKLDFMSHGSVEGNFYNKDITTGIQAYNYGMQHLLNILAEEIESQTFFISLSIAPIFPSQYAHSRRISCDVFGTIDWAEYMLNSLTYGWWIHDNLYKFNDPDHIVVYNSYNHREEILFNEGLTRYISSAISGTMMINSDDFQIPASRERAKEILTNEAINAVARSGGTFRPVEGDTSDKACDTFVRYDADGAVYLAVFNFSAVERKTHVVSLERIGLDPEKTYTMQNLWNGEIEDIQSEVRLRLDYAEPRIFKIIAK